MIRVMIKQAARRRGYKNAYQFGQSLGMSRNVAAKIWKNDQPPKLKTLDRICNAWGCGLDELIAHKRDVSSNGHASPASQQKRTGAKISGVKPAAKRGR